MTGSSTCSRLPASLLVPVMGVLLLLGGCSGSKEDTRVTFCRQLAANQTGTSLGEWKGVGNRFHADDYVAVSVEGPGNHAAVCYYDYDAQEPGAMEAGNPILGYATVPSRMEVDGRMMARGELQQSTMAQQVQQVRDVAHQAQQAIRQAASAADKALESQPGGQ